MIAESKTFHEAGVQFAKSLDAMSYALGLIGLIFLLIGTAPHLAWLFFFGMVCLVLGVMAALLSVSIFWTARCIIQEAVGKLDPNGLWMRCTMGYLSEIWLNNRGQWVRITATSPRTYQIDYPTIK